MSRPHVAADEVRRIAALARLTLTDAEVQRLAAELDDILGYVAQLEDVALPGQADPAHGAPAALTPALRDDEPAPSLSADATFDAAPAVVAGHFAVPRVVGE